MRTPYIEVQDYSVQALKLGTLVLITAGDPDDIESIIACGRIVHRGESRYYVELDNGERYYYQSKRFRSLAARMFFAPEELQRELFYRIKRCEQTMHHYEGLLGQLTSAKTPRARTAKALVQPVRISA